MISMVVYSGDNTELNKIKTMTEALIPLISGEKWDLHFSRHIEGAEHCIEKTGGSNIIIFDITGEKALESLEKLRHSYREAFIMLIADMKISPMSYMRPSIKAASLMLRPIEDESMRKVLKEFLIDFIEKREADDPKNVFKIETKGEVHYIPYNEIYYFEARKRKLYLRTLSEEYQFLDTVDNLETVLGDQFIRCHRSFIVNVRKIISIALSDNTIILTNELAVPLSRGYRNNIKKIMIQGK